jgi:hypothetical protein
MRGLRINASRRALLNFVLRWRMRAAVCRRLAAGEAGPCPWPVQQPIIVVGMHRSGTTLLAELLSELGVHMGARLGPETHEATFFQDLNVALLAAAHGVWDWPEPMRVAIAHDGLNAALASWLAQECCGPGIVSYLGWRAGLRTRSLGRVEGVWGWKDPRNTYTLPLWLRLFPNARVIHIYRNAVDVADSLVRRQARALKRLRRVAFSPRCMSHAGAFALWAEYVQMGLEAVQQVPQERRMEMCYETLLEDPLTEVERLAAFVGLPGGAERAQAMAARPRRDRAYAFASRPELYAFYQQVADHPLMCALGYDRIPPAGERLPGP